MRATLAFGAFAQDEPVGVPSAQSGEQAGGWAGQRAAEPGDADRVQQDLTTFKSLQ